MLDERKRGGSRGEPSRGKLRREIALRAAQLMYEREVAEYYQAKRKAARQLLRGDVRLQDLPSNREIREQICILASFHEGEERARNLEAMRLLALAMMRLLAPFHPGLIGSVLTGHVRKGSDVDLHLFTDSIAEVTMLLEDEGYVFDVEHKQVRKEGVGRVFTHIHVHARFPVELTVYSRGEKSRVFLSSITGKPIERATTQQVEELILREHPGVDVDEEVRALEDDFDPFLLYHMLLAPLEEVKQSPRHHPEGDALFHSLQVFELARRERPWDYELQLAALLHDVGKAIDPADHTAAGLEALEGVLPERTELLIADHMEAQAFRNGTMGARARARLSAADHFEDLMLLRDLDDRGRVPGARVCTLEEALVHLRQLAIELEDA